MRVRFAFLGLIVLILASCKTNTPLDLLAYPSESYWSLDPDDANAIAICSALEEQGYQFDEFNLSVSGQEVHYPDGETAQFPTQMSMSAIVVTGINRDFDSPNHVSTAEQQRLDKSAVTFCETYQSLAEELGIDIPLGSIIFWDWIVGLRGTYQFSETCEIIWQDGFGAGSYGHDYKYDRSLMCPSGHVSF